MSRIQYPSYWNNPDWLDDQEECDDGDDSGQDYDE